VIWIGGGHSHSLALKSDGTIVAWGWNGNGECTVPEGLIVYMDENQSYVLK
jgi:alpha-tubulin suppressor-like RCC1 family protein